MNAVHIEDAAGPEALRALTAHWDEMAASPHPPPLYMHPEHLLLWQGTLAPQAEVRVATAWEGDRCVGFAPFMVVPERLGPFRGTALRFVGNNIGAPGDLAYVEAWTRGRDPALAEALLRRVRERHRPSEWDLGFVPSDSPTALAAHRLLRLPAPSVGAADAKPFLTVELPDTWADYLARLSAQSRQKFHKNQRRLAAMGRLEVRVHRDPDGCVAAVQGMVANHERWWAGTPRAGWFGDGAVQAFLVAAARRLAERGEYLAMTLELDGRPIAWHGGAMVPGVHYSELISQDWDFEERSPGTVLSLAMVEHLIGLGIHRFHLGPGADQRKTVLGGIPQPYTWMRRYLGLWRAADAVQARWKRIHAPRAGLAPAPEGARSA